MQIFTSTEKPFSSRTFTVFCYSTLNETSRLVDQLYSPRVLVRMSKFLSLHWRSSNTAIHRPKSVAPQSKLCGIRDRPFLFVFRCTATFWCNDQIPMLCRGFYIPNWIGYVLLHTKVYCSFTQYSRESWRFFHVATVIGSYFQDYFYAKKHSYVEFPLMYWHFSCLTNQNWSRRAYSKNVFLLFHPGGLYIQF